VLNANDCGLNTAMLQAIGKRERVRLFLYTLNFMANGFPFPYLRSDAPDLAQRMDEIRDQVLEAYRTALRALRPEHSIAFAGPVTFGDAINAHLNRHPDALDWRAMIERLRPDADVWWPAPGARVIIEDGGARLEDRGSWPELLREHARKAPCHPGVPVPAAEPARIRAAAQACLARLGASLDEAPRRVGTPLVLSAVDRLEELEGGPLRWTVSIDFDARGVELVEHAIAERDVRPRPRPPYLWIVACHDAAVGFLTGEVKLDDLLLSARARFAREPDTFNAALHELLRFGHDEESLKEVTRLRTRAASSTGAGELEVEAQGERFVIPSLCPHEAESLELATTCGYELTCPRHRWVFDLRTGACVRGGDPSTNLYGERAPKRSP
jgi:nitrite reductase/ring-hydroxylating ferredoxin subunit